MKIHDFDQGTRYSFLAPDSCADEEEEEEEGSDQKNKLVLVIIFIAIAISHRCHNLDDGW